MSRVGVEPEESNLKEGWAAAQPSLWLALSGSAVEYSVSEAREIADTKTYAFKYLNLVIASFSEAVGVGIVKCVEYVFVPVVDRRKTRFEFWKGCQLRKQDPFGKTLLSLCRRL